MMSFAFQLVSDFVFTPYILRQRHARHQPEFESNSLTVTCVILMMSRISSMLLSAVSIPT